MRCPVCNEEISELDEKCPNCGIKFDDNMDFEETMEKETSEGSEHQRTNADCLNTMANINVVVSIIISMILIFPNLVEVSNEPLAFIYIILGIVCLISGITLCFFFKTIVDIYRKVGE